MEEWPHPEDSYLNRLREHYVDEAVNAMLANSTDRKFTRLYPITSLIELYDKDEPRKLFEYGNIIKKAKELGYKGTNSGIRFGLHILWELGIVENEGGDGGSYRIDPRFLKGVLAIEVDLKAKLKRLK